MRFRPSLDELLVDELPEMLLGEGEHSFRLIFNPKKFKNCHNLDVTVLDPRSQPVPVRVERWGTKMRVFVDFGPSQDEGVCEVFVDGLDVVVARFWFVR